MTISKRKKGGTWLDRLERKFGKYAINNFSKFIIIICIIGAVISFVNPNIYFGYLSLDFSRIFHGQIWRLFTFILYPPQEVSASNPTGILWLAIELYLYYVLGNSIERTIGAFRLNCYYFLGVIFLIIGNLIAYLLFGNQLLSYAMGMISATDMAYVNRSLVFLFALLYPDVEFLLFFIIPVKSKYIAWIDAAFIGYYFVKNIMTGARLIGDASGLSIIYFAVAFSILLSVLNFVIFYFEMKSKTRIPYKQRKRTKEFKKKVQELNVKKASHECCVCKRTQEDFPDLQFRYCSKCSGNKEYCSDHLFTHQHM